MKPHGVSGWLKRKVKKSNIIYQLKNKNNNMLYLFILMQVFVRSASSFMHKYLGSFHHDSNW